MEELAVGALGAVAVLVAVYVALSVFRGRGRGPPFELEERVIVVTGAANGIGRELCKQFARSNGGCTIHLLDVDGGALSEAVEQVNSIGRRSLTVAKGHLVNVSDLKALDKVCREIQKDASNTGRHVSVLVNNACVVRGKPFASLSVEEFEDTIRLGTSAHFCALKALLPEMVSRNDGMIVTVSSLMGLLPGTKLIDYCAAKHATIGLHDSLRLELSGNPDNNVHMLCVLPYAVDTGMFEGAFEHASLSLTRFLFPFLEASTVASSICTSMKNREYLLTLPRSLALAPYVAKVLPVPLFQALLETFGASRGMDTFRGRPRKEKGI